MTKKRSNGNDGEYSCTIEIKSPGSGRTREFDVTYNILRDESEADHCDKCNGQDSLIVPEEIEIVTIKTPSGANRISEFNGNLEFRKVIEAAVEEDHPGALNTCGNCGHSSKEDDGSADLDDDDESSEEGDDN